jgi:cytidylate kinase
MIITVSRQMGARGAEVAEGVAAALGWRVVDNELVDRVATRAGMAPEDVAAREERAPGFFERLIRMASRAAPELFPVAADPVPEPELEEDRLVRATEAAVAELALEGRVVLVGRAAPAVLSQDRDALHVKIVAPVELRVGRIAERMAIPAKEAAHLVHQSDAGRRRYHEQHYRRNWDDAANYHIVLNTGALGVAAAAELVVADARRHWPA